MNEKLPWSLLFACAIMSEGYCACFPNRDVHGPREASVWEYLACLVSFGTLVHYFVGVDTPWYWTAVLLASSAFAGGLFHSIFGRVIGQWAYRVLFIVAWPGAVIWANLAIRWIE